MSDNLGFGRIPDGVATPEVLVNAALEQIDALFSESLELDLSSANQAVTLENLKTANFISLNGAATDRTVTLPQTKRTIFAKNYGTATVTLSRGTGTLAIPAGEARTVRLTGAANGIEDIAGGGGSSGGGGGIEEAPEDGTLYGRKDGAWAAVPTSGGGGGGSGGLVPIKPPTNGMFDVTYTDGVSTRVEAYGDNFYSALRTDTGRSGDQSVNFRGMSIPNPSGNWTCDAVIKAPVFTRVQNVTHALGVRGASGTSYFFGFNPSNSDYLMTLLKFNNNSYVAAPKTYAIRPTDYLMFRIQKTATHHRWFVSSDFGLTFDLFYEEVLASFGSGPATAIGINHNSFDSFPSLNRLLCPYFNFVEN